MTGRKLPRDPPTLACPDSGAGRTDGAKLISFSQNAFRVETIRGLRQTSVFRVKAPYHLTRMRGWRGNGQKQVWLWSLRGKDWVVEQELYLTNGSKNVVPNPGPRKKRREKQHTDQGRVDEPGPPKDTNRKLSDLEFEIVAQAFLEVFELLQEYPPAWYTEQHHNRALAAHRILQKNDTQKNRSAQPFGHQLFVWPGPANDARGRSPNQKFRLNTPSFPAEAKHRYPTSSRNERR